MIRLPKFRGFPSTLPLKVRKKNERRKIWKTALQNYGNDHNSYAAASAKKRLSWMKFAGKFAKLEMPIKMKRKYFSREEVRKAYSRKAIRLIGAGVFLVLAAALLYKPVHNSLASLEIFRLKDIGIYGYSLIKPEELKRLAGIDYTTSMISVSKEKITGYIARHPWVKSVEVDKIWPDTIRIDIKEHRPAAMLLDGTNANGKMMYIDRQGKRIAPVESGDELDFPVITGMDGIPPEQQEPALADAVAFLKFIAYNNPNLPAQSVSEIHFDPAEGMVVRLVDFPFPIYFGRGEVKKKYRQLRSVLAVLYKKRKNDIDISEVQYIRVNYLEDKVLVAQTNSG